MIGSAKGIEWDRKEDEFRHVRRISRSFAMGSTEVTQDQFQRFHRMILGNPILGSLVPAHRLRLRGDEEVQRAARRLGERADPADLRDEVVQ